MIFAAKATKKILSGTPEIKNLRKKPNYRFSTPPRTVHEQPLKLPVFDATILEPTGQPHPGFCIYFPRRQKPVVRRAVFASRARRQKPVVRLQ